MFCESTQRIGFVIELLYKDLQACQMCIMFVYFHNITCICYDVTLFNKSQPQNMLNFYNALLHGAHQLSTLIIWIIGQIQMVKAFPCIGQTFCNWIRSEHFHLF